MPARCFYFNVTKEMATHLDAQRNTNPNREHLSKRVGRMPINIFFSRFEYPTVSEGFTEVKEVRFVGKFVNEDDKSQFYSFS